MSMVKEFREFAVKGNVVDLAVGVDFSGLALQVGQAKLQYGKFIQTCLDFVIVAWAIFIAVKLINRLKREEDKPAETKAPPRQEVLLEEIRDLLKKN